VRGNPNKLRPFALWLAFPTSDYYGRSDAQASHWWTAHLGIPACASHVHKIGLLQDHL